MSEVEEMISSEDKTTSVELDAQIYNSIIAELELQTIDLCGLEFEVDQRLVIEENDLKTELSIAHTPITFQDDFDHSRSKG